MASRRLVDARLAIVLITFEIPFKVFPTKGMRDRRIGGKTRSNLAMGGGRGTGGRERPRRTFYKLQPVPGSRHTSPSVSFSSDRREIVVTGRNSAEVFIKIVPKLGTIARQPPTIQFRERPNAEHSFSKATNRGTTRTAVRLN